MLRSIFMLALLTLVAAESEDYWQSAVWQDAQLLLSFLTGILFVQSGEAIFERGARSKIQLCTLLA